MIDDGGGGDGERLHAGAAGVVKEAKAWEGKPIQ